MAIGSPNVTSRVAAMMAAGMVVLCGCPTTRQTRTVEKSGFLGDYSQLREGGQGEAQLVYIKPGVRWASYDKVVIDPVTIWTSGDSSVAKVSDADRQLLADYLDASLRNSLSQMYTLVSGARAWRARSWMGSRRSDSPPRSIAARVRRPCAGASARGPTCRTPSTSGPSVCGRDSQSSARAAEGVRAPQADHGVRRIDPPSPTGG